MPAYTVHGIPLHEMSGGKHDLALQPAKLSCDAGGNQSGRLPGGGRLGRRGRAHAGEPLARALTRHISFKTWLVCAVLLLEHAAWHTVVDLVLRWQWNMRRLIAPFPMLLSELSSRRCSSEPPFSFLRVFRALPAEFPPLSLCSATGPSSDHGSDRRG
eukprot:6171915-Pleurochrysis_carterae.AAC.5